MLGDFNLSNLLAVAGVLGALSGDIQKWLIALNAAKPAVGRMHKFSANEKATVVKCTNTLFQIELGKEVKGVKVGITYTNLEYFSPKLKEYIVRKKITRLEFLK